MELFFQFIVAKWYFFAAVATLLFMLLGHERRKGGVSITPAQLTAILNREDGVVLDLRDAADFRQGHIVDSVNLPFSKLGERIAEIERYRDKPVIVVCKMGQSAGAATRTLKEKGFEKVYRLGGGIMEWQASQLPLVRS